MPSISLPKGGGAIRGLGEKFAANLVTGGGTMTVPLATTPGRAGYGPELALSYDSGAGNGPFGFGWSLSLPSITRKTDKGLPQYLDEAQSDVFLLSGAEDLVPVLDSNASPVADTTSVVGYTIHRFRPRVEGLFARIERWTRISDGDVHWRSISASNVLSIYGIHAASRIADPSDPRRVFRWSICETRDDRGNAIVFDYKPDDGQGIDPSRVSEQHRGAASSPGRTTNRYIKRIRYGNTIPLLDESGRRPHFITDLPAHRRDENAWMFEVVFDYGEHDVENPSREEATPWSLRGDPFSSYRAGFEVRTTRLCRRVLMFHHFADEPNVGLDCLVRSTDLTYAAPEGSADGIYTFLVAIGTSGYRRRAGGYLRRTVPPVELEYTRPKIQDVVATAPADRLENLPIGVDGSSYRWVDLHGEGIPGILTEQGGEWFYRRNFSALADGEVELGALQAVRLKPTLALAAGADLVDLAGDGQIDVVVLDGATPGFFEHDDDDGWLSFRPFEARLGRPIRRADARLVDLTGDGRADLLITHDDALVWHPSLGETGFGPAHRLAHALDEAAGPRLVFMDGTESVHLADLSGDGLTDIVRVRNGEVCYWPNLGYGRFGPRVTMDDAPHFDEPDMFDPGRLRLADIDGSGTTDIIYLHRDGVRVYFNRSGNGWSAERRLDVAPPIADGIEVAVTDLLGNGTACLVWSSPLPADAGRQLVYVDLMGNEKPHLLTRVVNNLGAETRIRYAPSTRFYLEDLRNGRPWITKLPFPVHVVERVETWDRISRNKFVTRSAYHHGYFDGVEREFRGFGMVEQWDTEEIGALSADGDVGVATNLDAASAVPPVHTKTWFHTGVYLGRDRISDFFAGLHDEDDIGEYYRAPNATDEQARRDLLDDSSLPPGLTLEEEREACRALEGTVLRQEVYALDGTPREPHPYQILEQSFAVRLVQPRGPNRHAVFLTHPREVLTFGAERDPGDPRVQHAMTLEVDDFGNVLKEITIGYGRRQPDGSLPLQSDRDRQTRMLIVYTEAAFTNAVDDMALHPFDYRAPQPCETRTWELTGYTPRPGAARLSRDDLVVADSNDPTGWRMLLQVDGEIPYEAQPGPDRQRRLVEHNRVRYRPDDLGTATSDATALLPLGSLEPLALPGESYTLALTPGLLASVFLREGEALLPDPHSVLAGGGADRGGYVDLDGDGHFWIPTGRIHYSAAASDTAAEELSAARAHFFLPRRAVDPFGASSKIRYDAYDLLPIESEDAVGNRTTVGERDANGNILTNGNDYRVLQPAIVSDPNRNRVAVAFDTLGLVVGAATMGKPEENVGDSLDGFDPDPDEQVLLAHLEDPLTNPAALLGSATTRVLYDPYAFHRTRTSSSPRPTVAYTISRETHVSDVGTGATPGFRHAFSYADGLGREIQQKVQAEPGPIAEGGPHLEARWVGSGWTIFDNKGQPVRRYEPFFDDTHHFRFAHAVGVSSVLFYDPLGRVVATLHPDHTWSKVVFGAWRSETWDENDTLLIADPTGDPDVGGFFSRLPTAEVLPTWYQRRVSGALGTAAKDCAIATESHAGTPSVAHLDTLGRVFLTITHNRTHDGSQIVDQRSATRVTLDIEGKQLDVVDAKGRVVLESVYDVAGRQIHRRSMDAGESWALVDVAGQALRGWDSRGHTHRKEYDGLRRLLRAWVVGADADDPTAELLVGRSVYGEIHPDAEARNLRGVGWLVFDPAGLATTEACDFKGNVVRSSRRLAIDYVRTVDWSPIDAALVPTAQGAVDLVALEAALATRVESEVFVSELQLDALDRPIRITSPDASVTLPTYNDAGLLEAVVVRLRGDEQATAFVSSIDYDAIGRRTFIAYANGITTRYAYDGETLRLSRVTTSRGNGSVVLQDLHYTYDPSGNIGSIRDDAQQTVYFDNAVVSPNTAYVYDALYRLIRADGREHAGQGGTEPANRPELKPHYDFNDSTRRGLVHPNDGQALRRYTQRFEYDEVGNILALVHQAAGAGWTRRYAYAADSNRLLATSLPGDLADGPYSAKYEHDAHGNMTSMPHLAAIRWDFRDRMHSADLGGGGTLHFVHDGSGRRVRRVHVHAGSTIEERIDLGGFEIYRRRNGSGIQLERQTLHVMDDKRRVALVETKTIDEGSPVAQAGPTIRYQLDNHLGSSCLELDDAGAIITYEEYHPYGTTSYRAGRTAAETSLKRYRYTGKERDEHTGLYHHGARDYAPWLGRWTAADPAGLVDGVNVFAYGSNNPVRFTDPTGRQSQSKVEPIREGMLIGDHPRLASLWQKAVEGYLEKRYGLGSYRKNYAAFQKELASLPEGSNREKGTRINLARRAFNAVSARFRRMVKLPTGTQIHHMGEHGLAANPSGALNASGLEIVNGHATVRGTSHHRAHVVRDRLAAGERNPGPEATADMERARAASKSDSPTTPAKPTPKPTPKPKAPASKPAAPKPKAPPKPKGGGAAKAVNALGLALVARDMVKAETNEQRVEIAKSASEGMVLAWGVSKIPGVGAPLAVMLGGGSVGYGTGMVLAEDVIPDPVNVAVGKTLVHDVIGASQDDLEILRDVDITDAAAIGIGGVIVHDVLGTTPEKLEEFSIFGIKPFSP